MTRIVVYALLGALALGGGALGVHHWRSGLIARGDAQGAARVRAAWNEQVRKNNEITERENLERFRNAEQIARQVARLHTQRDAARADTAAALDQLRHAAARLNARARSYPGTDAGVAACAGEATTARELFGESAAALVELASAADGLRIQVGGLQDFARDVCRAGRTQSKDARG